MSSAGSGKSVVGTREVEAATNARLRMVPIAAAGIAGALLGVAAMHTIDPVITMPEALGSFPLMPTPEFMAEYNSAYRTMAIANSAINFAVAGACFGLALGLAIWASVKPIPGLLTAFGGAAGGAVGGAMTGWLISVASENQGRVTFGGVPWDPMLQSVIFQALCWGGIGVGVGLAVLYTSRRKNYFNALVGGMLGGLAAGMVHAVIGSFAFPNSGIMQVLPPTINERIIWASCSGLCVALALFAMLRQKLPTVSNAE